MDQVKPYYAKTLGVLFALMGLPGVVVSLAILSVIADVWPNPLIWCTLYCSGFTAIVFGWLSAASFAVDSRKTPE